jgi:hypothetical protein
MGALLLKSTQEVNMFYFSEPGFRKRTTLLDCFLEKHFPFQLPGGLAEDHSERLYHHSGQDEKGLF